MPASGRARRSVSERSTAIDDDDGTRNTTQFFFFVFMLFSFLGARSLVDFGTAHEQLIAATGRQSQAKLDKIGRQDDDAAEEHSRTWPNVLPAMALARPRLRLQSLSLFLSLTVALC